MSRSVLFVCSTLMMVYMDVAVCDLKKYREWPPAVKVPTPDIKRQYEYDPEAGAISKKLISTSYKFMYGSKVVSSTQINYKNSAAISGTAGWNYGVATYHGFGFISSFDLAVTQKLIYQSQGKWPADAVKVYMESVDAKGNVTKTGSVCRQKKSFHASSIFPTLPGKLYRYECSVSTGMISDGFTWAPGAHTVISYYSDYLDTSIFTDTNYDPPVVDGVQGFATTTYLFVDDSGVQQNIILPEAEMKAVFSQQ
jgi:hypothetical protein